MKRRWNVFFIAGAAMMLAVGCSPKAQETAETTTAQEMSESIQMSEIVDESKEADRKSVV